MKQNSLFIIIASILLVAVTSCGGNSNSSDAEQVDKALSKAKTAEAARNISGRQLLSETPDTVFLDYYWGMSKKDADALTKKYISEKKMYRDDFVRETIHYNMAINEIGLVPTTFGCFYYKDSLAQIIFMADIYSKSVEVLDFVSTFSNHYLDKGYVVISEASDPVFTNPVSIFTKETHPSLFLNTKKCIV